MILYHTGGGGVWRGAKLYYIIIEWPLMASMLETTRSLECQPHTPPTFSVSDRSFVCGELASATLLIPSQLFSKNRQI